MHTAIANWTNLKRHRNVTIIYPQKSAMRLRVSKLGSAVSGHCL